MLDSMKTTQLFALTAIIWGSSLCIKSSAAEPGWTGWLGPNRDGQVQEFIPPTQWPDKLLLAWRVNVGSGYGTPLVEGNKIYVHSRMKDSETIACLNKSTGDTIWSKSEKTPFTMGGGGESHGKGPKSNPVMADGRIFTFSITGVLSAWSAENGDKLWSRNYGSRFEKPHPYWGASTSPVVDGNQVIVHFGSCDKGVLAAFDVTSGDEIWSREGDGACYSSPNVVEIHGVRQIVEWNHRALIGVENKTGKLLWEFPLPHLTHNQNMPTPAFHNGRFYVGGENRGMRCVEPSLNDGKWSASEVWFQRKAPLDMSSPVINNNLLYGFSHYERGHLFCLDTATGEILWKGPSRTGDNATFLSAPGHVFALIDDGEFRVLAADPADYKVHASYKVSDQPTWAAPVVLKDGFLIKDKETLAFWKLIPSTDPKALN